MRVCEHDAGWQCAASSLAATPRGKLTDSAATAQLHFLLLISRQAKVRLTKWYTPYPQKTKTKFIRECSNLVLSRAQKLCNFIEWHNGKIVYKRCAPVLTHMRMQTHMRIHTHVRHFNPAVHEPALQMPLSRGG